eukprot:s2573_g9.t1
MLTQVVGLVSSLSGQLQAVSAAATFNSSGITQKNCISFLPCETFQATFNSRWPPTAPGETLGDLASAVEYATDAAIAKLVKDTERHLQSLSPWVYLRAGQQLESRQGKTATVVQVLFDKSEPISLEVEWAVGKRQTATRLSTIKVDDEVFLHAEFQEGVSHEFSARKLPWTATPVDVAAETRFVIVLLSSFASKEKGSSVLGRLESRLQSCSTQLRCSGCCTTTIPLVLGGGAGGLRMATHLREALSTRSSWWMPFYQADASNASNASNASDAKAEVTRLMERITEDLGGWLKSWDEIEASLTGPWMSKSEVAELRAVVRDLQRRVAELEANQSRASSADSFQLVLQAEGPEAETPIPQAGSSSRPEAETPQGGEYPSEVATHDTEARVLLAKGIGKFLRRAVSGQPRGSSGRDRLRLQNRCYLVIADFSGQQLAVPKFLTSFAEVRQLCKRGADVGGSVFVGLPTKWEARALLVREPGADSTHYSVAHVSFVIAEEPAVVNLIPVAAHEGKLLVAVPHEVWHRTLAKRLLPQRALSRAILVEVLVAYEDEPETVVEEESMRLWLGLLDKNMVPAVRLGKGVDAMADVCVEDHTMGRTMIPYGPSLQDLSEEHFAFHSAEPDVATFGEGEAPPEQEVEEQAEERAEKGRDAMEERMQELEGTMKSIQESLAVLVQRPTKSAATPKPAAAKDLPGLDPAVLQSARQAGIEEDQLVRLSAMLAKNNKMADVPRPKKSLLRPKAQNPLSESEEDEKVEEVEAEAADPGGGVAGSAVEAALVQLTKIAGDLAKDREKKSKDLETLLDGVDPEGESTSSSGSKSKAAVYKKLKGCLQSDPAFIYKTVEERLETDFNLMRSAPGSAHQATSARAWLEHRSKLGNFASTVRYTWALCGIWDCLRAGAVQEARARVALAVLAADQTAIDAGSWLLSQEILLEDPPPLASFQQKRSVDHWDQPSSKLLDERWQEVLMWRVKSKDSYLESRKRLTTGGGKPSRESTGKGDSSRDQREKGKGKKGKDKKPPQEAETTTN